MSAPTPEVVVEVPRDRVVAAGALDRATVAGAPLPRVRADDVQTTALSPADVVGARRGELRRAMTNVVSQIACYMADPATSNAARARCAQAIEVNANLLSLLSEG